MCFFHEGMRDILELAAVCGIPFKTTSSLASYFKPGGYDSLFYLVLSVVSRSPRGKSQRESQHVELSYYCDRSRVYVTLFLEQTT